MTRVPATAPPEVTRPTNAPTDRATAPPPTEVPTPTSEPTPEPVNVSVGTSVGETPPAFAFQLVDGSEVASTQLIAAGRPVFMFYFATW